MTPHAGFLAPAQIVCNRVTICPIFGKIPEMKLNRRIPWTNVVSASRKREEDSLKVVAAISLTNVTLTVAARLDVAMA
jgi:hypothetical protein